MKTQDRIVLSWCDPGTVDGAFASDMMALAGVRSSRFAEIIRIRGGGLLSRTRNMMVCAFLDQTDAAWLLMVDSDHRVSTQAFDMLVDAAHDKTHPVVAGMYFAAYPSNGPYPVPIPCAFDLVDGNYTPISEIEPRGLRRVDGVGTGGVLIHRSVLQNMRDAAGPLLREWCWFQDGPQPDGRWLSEDLTFCKRLGAAGVPIHVHTGAVLPHHKDFWQDDRTWKMWRKPDGD